MTHFFLAVQATPAAPSSGISVPALVFQGAAIFAIFWFMLIRPQQRERKKLESTIMSMKRGDEVLTAGGIIAEVVHIQLQRDADGKEASPSMTDRVTVRSGESKLIVERGRIARVTPREAKES